VGPAVDSSDSSDSGGLAIAAGLAVSRLSTRQLWWDYITMGGSHNLGALEDYMSGRTTWSRYQHDFAAQALNDYFVESGLDHIVAYSDEL
jgi:hypothetical protein